jgi:hypothetical protein
MTTLAALLLLWSSSFDDPRNRRVEFHLAGVEESKSWHDVARTGGVSHNVHALKLTIKRIGFFNDNDDHDVYISIRNHHGFGSVDPELLTAGYDDVAGTPPEGTSQDWFHYTPNTNFNAGVVVYYCRPTSQSTELPAGHIWVVIREDATGSEPDKRAIYKLRIDLRKRIVTGDGPIDTRLVYGEPNDEGWYANANGMLRYVNFNPWIYKGGLFVGNMPTATGDGSGKSRSQFWFDNLSQDDEDYLQFMNFSLAHVGPPAFSNENFPSHLNHKGEVSIGLWAGVEQQGHTGVTESTATWENRWVLSGNPWPPESGNDPAGVQLPAWTAGSENYLNFPLSLVDPESAAMTHKDDAFTRLFLALANEAAFTDARWRYFVSKESAHNGWPANSGFQSQDLKPRQWAAVLGYGGYTVTDLESQRGMR